MDVPIFSHLLLTSIKKNARNAEGRLLNDSNDGLVWIYDCPRAIAGDGTVSV
jgi:hypothetical protein